MLRVADNPPTVYPPGAALDGLSGRWWVAHTRSRFEKAFAGQLAGLEISYFLPMREVVRVSGGRKRRLLAPLFPGYVFFCGPEEDRYRALATHRLCQALPVPEQDRLVENLLHVQKALEGKAPLEPYPFAAVGRRCRVTAGPFRGIEGVVVRRDRLHRLVLEVKMLGQGAWFEVEGDLLEPAD